MPHDACKESLSVAEPNKEEGECIFNLPARSQKVSTVVRLNVISEEGKQTSLIAVGIQSRYDQEPPLCFHLVCVHSSFSICFPI